MDTSLQRVTFGIIARRRTAALDTLVDRLLELSEGTGSTIVAVVESPDAESPVEHLERDRVRWIEVPARRGVAYNRNRVLEAVSSDILVWADDDCMPQDGWLEALLGALEDRSLDAAAGVIHIPPAGYLGDSISALGFPAGGSAGYATMFPVNPDGTTENLPSGNSAVRMSAMREVGGFDESMTFGGEDTELSHRLVSAGKRIAFVPSAVLVHPARTSLREFASWSFRRGRAKRQFSRRVAVGGYVGRRLGSYGAILKQNSADTKVVPIALLLGANLVLQALGYATETLSPVGLQGTVQRLDD